MSDSGNAPSWLFSFVDLAFLLLIAMTQLAQDPSDPVPELGSIVVPRIDETMKQDLPSEAHERWQLRIHPDQAEGSPFELAHLGGDALTPGARLAHEGLMHALRGLQADGTRKPLLAPHEDSRSQDLLDAVAALETFWPGSRRAAIAPRLATQ